MRELSISTNKHVGKLANAFRNIAPKKEILKEEPVKEISPASSAHSKLEEEFHSHLHKGTIALVSTVAILVGWAAFVPLAGAVIGNGKFMVHVHTKKVQHKSGGQVKEIAVHDGSTVKTGDLLLRLDPTEAKAQVEVLERSIDEANLKISRLTAERDNAEVIWPTRYLCPPSIYKDLVKGETDFFKIRKQAHTDEQRVAEKKVAQLNKQIKGLEAQLHSNKKQKDINEDELAGLEGLMKKGFTTKPRITPLQKSKEQLIAAEAQTQTSIQEVSDKINETQLAAKEADEKWYADVRRDLNAANTELGQLLGKYVVAMEALNHTDIYAPVSGVVQELAVHTIGGVVTPAEPLMTIVPENEPLEVTVKLPSDKIDQVRLNQPARIKLTAFDRTTPEIHGAVNYISPDVIDDKYEIHVTVDQSPFDFKLTPGMPAEVFLETYPRTMLSYLSKPLIEQLHRMFTER